jgi:hypothetical protein
MAIGRLNDILHGEERTLPLAFLPLMPLMVRVHSSNL